MRQFIWKLRFTIRFSRITRSSFGFSWDCAESWMEMLKGDTSESPSDCVDEEIDESMRDV